MKAIYAIRNKIDNKKYIGKSKMAKKVSEKKMKYDFYQYDKRNNFIKKFDSVKQIIAEYPNYKWQNIYSVCNGYKKSYMGFIWKKQLKI